MHMAVMVLRVMIPPKPAEPELGLNPEPNALSKSYPPSFRLQAQALQAIEEVSKE